ncbi:MAG: InlB B-repeat-containing protein [Planctomycetota bacterium]|jgi:hypothetical protein
MKQKNLNLVIFVIGIIFIVFSSRAYCQGDGTALLVQVSPPGAGVVTPEPGVHRFTSESQVNLSAVPNQGYQFVYWLGDVIEPAKENTLALLEGPKIIVAVFEKSNFSFIPEEPLTTPGAGQGGVFSSRPDFSVGSGGGIIRRRRFEPFRASGDGDDDDDGEEEETEFPVPEVPEPATSGMFLLGTLMLMAKRKRKR